MAISMLYGAQNLKLVNGIIAVTPSGLGSGGKNYPYGGFSQKGLVSYGGRSQKTRTLVGPICSVSSSRPASQPRFIQHKQEAFWFYRFLSIVYDHVINPGHWTEDMRDDALEPAELYDRNMVVVDVGGGTGFTTLGIVKHVDAKNVTILDQSPHQLAKAKEKEPLKECKIVEGDAEDLPFPTDYADRYVSAGSIEYWPDPQRGIKEAYRVLKIGGRACLIGPVHPTFWLSRFFADVWMLFPKEEEYIEWFKNAGFKDVQLKRIGPKWYRGVRRKVQIDAEKVGNRSEACKHSISLSGSEFSAQGRVMVLPCGLTLGSHITLVGRPRAVHQEFQPKIALVRDGESSMVSQFKVELLGLKTVEGEEPPRLLHFNPRLRGDWSGRPVIELNTCYRMQWGSALRCEGWKSKADEETVDGQVKCEKWIRDDDSRSVETKATWWLSRLVGRTKKVPVDWPYPFAEKKLFVLTLTAGLEGYHVNVDGRHVTSFPYHMGFSLEDATGLSLSGDVNVQSVFAASLPSSHPSFAPEKHLEMSTKWQAPPLPDGGVELFIGILSAGNHFAERMAVRKSWMQHNLIRSSKVVARFFVALHAKKEVNVELKKEAEFFGDIVIVPYMDNYDLVVLKTVAICEYGARRMAAKYIMKCDDDTFIRVDAVIKEAYKVPEGKSLYVGNINYFHKPLRYGKWAVTYEEWPEEDYPPYANGPGYILSSDIANFVVSEFESRKLRLFKMEDVSMGMWVEKFNSAKPVEYVHSFKFCQFGCVEDYYTAHYQSPRQMICMWDKLKRLGRPQCCSMR